MVVTRRAVKTEAIVDDKHALQKTIVVMSAPEPSNKRRKISKHEALPEDGVKVVTAAVEPLSPILHPLKAAKRKARPKLLQTLHTKETLPAIQEKAAQIYAELMQLYKDPPCPLDHQNHFQLLTSVILSAQSTDKKVNEITPPLYEIAPDANAMAQLEVSSIEKHIRQIGLAPTKAKNISNMSKALVERHGGEVPDTFEELEQLAGVGHKTASVVMSVAFQ